MPINAGTSAAFSAALNALDPVNPTDQQLNNLADAIIAIFAGNGITRQTGFSIVGFLSNRLHQGANQQTF